MLDLSAPNVRAYWEEAEPELTGLLDRFSRVEDWTLDDVPVIAKRLVLLGSQLSQPGSAERLSEANRNTLLFFFAYLSTARAFFIIRWLDDHHDFLGSRLLERLLTDEGREVVTEVVDPMLSDVMIQRLRVLQNTPYFTRLFAPSMLESIERAIHSYRQEVADEASR